MAGLSENVLVKIVGDDASLTNALGNAGRNIDAFKGKTVGLSTAVAGVTTNMDKLRGPMAAVTQGVLQMAPGFSTLTSVMGQLAFGGAVTVGILAGITAIGAAYQALTSETRAAAAATRDLLAATEEARRAGLGPMYGIANNLGNSQQQLAGVNAQLNDRFNLGTILGGRDRRFFGYKLPGITPTDDLLGQQSGLMGAVDYWERKRSDYLLEHQSQLDPLVVTATTSKTAADRAKQEAERRFRLQLSNLNRSDAMMQMFNEQRLLASDIGRKNMIAEFASVSDWESGLDGNGVLGGAINRRGIKFNKGAALSAGIGGISSLLQGGGMSALLGAGAGVASAIEGPLGIGLSLGITALGALFGNKHEQEERMKRAHLAALKEARQDIFNFTIVIPKGVPNPSDPDWKEALGNMMYEMAGTNTGRVKFQEAA